MTLEPPRFPELHVYRLDDIAALDPVEVLRLWVNGRQFHRYAEPIHDQAGYDFSTRAALDFRAHLSEGRLSWYVSVRQHGTGTDGWAAGHSTMEGAAYAILSRIEQDERASFEQNLVLGTA